MQVFSGAGQSPKVATASQAATHSPDVVVVEPEKSDDDYYYYYDDDDEDNKSGRGG